jgi:hypothetical protein
MNGASVLVAALLLAAVLKVQAADYKYVRTGSDHDITTKTARGYALIGGGSDLDEAFRFLCQKGAGGDFLVLRAAGDDDYNPLLRNLTPVGVAGPAKQPLVRAGTLAAPRS